MVNCRGEKKWLWRIETFQSSSYTASAADTVSSLRGYLAETLSNVSVCNVLLSKQRLSVSSGEVDRSYGNDWLREKWNGGTIPHVNYACC